MSRPRPVRVDLWGRSSCGGCYIFGTLHAPVQLLCIMPAVPKPLELSLRALKLHVVQTQLAEWLSVTPLELHVR